MKSPLLWLGTALLVAAAAFGTAQSDSDDGLVVHEWGTFLAMNGADGVTLDGMYHEEHALPPFVHARSKDQLRMPTVSLKGETPVIYFYTNRRQQVTVRVKFPDGVWTQWYPQASLVKPSVTQTGSPLEAKNGFIAWRAEILPGDTAKSAPAPPTTQTDALWNYARDVDAALVRTIDRTSGKERAESDRFLFYRGLGRAKLPLQMTSEKEGTLVYSTNETDAVSHLFVLRVENGKGVYRYIPALAPGERVNDVIPTMKGALPMPEFTRKIADDLADKLTEAGLYGKEARAMVNTWSQSYFQTDGVRVLFALPQSWTDRFIPMEVEPRPKKIVRVMVGRLELILPEREKQAETAIRDLASPDTTKREHAYAFLQEQGRYMEPVIRRTLQTTKSETVRTLCKRLLLTDTVTELRTALSHAATGKTLTDTPLHARAQLAALLHEIGLDKQAKAEGRAVHAELQRTPAPPIEQADFRQYGRAYARTMEALDDTEGAAKWYGKFVRFGSNVKNCGGCHVLQGPRDMTFFRDWWAGKKFAAYTLQTQSFEKAIAEQKAALDRKPDDLGAQMMLAYLYDYRGEKAKASPLWASIEGKSRRQVVRASSK